jgi:hypothetical protein
LKTHAHSSFLTLEMYFKTQNSTEPRCPAVACMLLCLALIMCLGLVAVAQEKSEDALTNASVVKLVRAGFKEKTVIAIIHSRPVRFELTPDRLVELKKKGVSENIILAMIARDAGATMSDSFGSDDSFFDRADDAMGGKRGSRRDEGSTGIFGSGGRTKRTSRSRAGSGSTEGDTETTGSATVHIVRPPVEQGSAPPKLEKTPTLNNESVVGLVEAGFSEGTIIRRIEQSPVDFDLSPAKLTELRKRRVAEPVIAAMKAAMSDEATPPNSPSTASPEK